MTIPLTSETIASAYDYLRTTPPFSRWNLPEPEDVIFRVSRDPHAYGWFDGTPKSRKGKHKIIISKTCVGHTQTLITTVAHEMVHLHMVIRGMGYGHGVAFNKHWLQVCNTHGFDPRAF